MFSDEPSSPAPLPVSITVDSGPSINTQSTAVLFAFDNRSIPASHNLRLQMKKPEKVPHNPVIARGHPGDPDALRAGGVAVLQEEDRWRMWYQAWDESGSRVAYAESSDGIHWTKPNLGLVEFRGDRNNNLVDIEPGVDVRSILYDETAPEHRRYVMLAVDRSWWKGWKTDVPSMTRIETSPDGFHWSPLQEEPGIIFPQNKAISLYQFNGYYHLGGYQVSPLIFHPGQPESLGRDFIAPRTFSIWKSPKLDQWPRERTVAFYKPIRSSSSPYRKGWDREEVHVGAMVTPYPNVCLGLYGQWHHPINDGPPEYHAPRASVDLGFLLSNDGLHFREPAPGFTFLPRDQEKAWDRDFPEDTPERNLLLFQGPMLNAGDRTHIYYSATTPGGNVAGVNMNSGLALLPRDRFGALIPITESQPASFLTCPLEVMGEVRLAANATLPEGASLRFTLMDENGLQEMAEYTDGSSGEANGELKRPVRWKQKIDLPPERKFRIRVEFLGEGIELYALYLQPAN